MKKLLDKISWNLIIVACLSLGLAPFAPPHIYQKLVMLFNGNLVAPMDWLDLLWHGWPWILLCIKSIYYLKTKKNS